MKISASVMAAIFVVVSMVGVAKGNMELHQMMIIALLANILIAVNNIKRVDEK